MNRTALVIGGGPAGLSAGIAFARAGYDVEVHEQRPDWKGRVCGSFLNPDAVRALEWLGLLDEARQRGAVPVLETMVATPSGRTSRVSTMQGGTPSLAFQRRKLEELLAEELERRGGRLIAGSRVIQSDRRGQEWVTVTRLGEYVSHVHTEIVVRAGGRFLDAEGGRGGGWYGWNALFCNARQSPGEMGMFFGRGGYVGVLTFADGTTNVCGLSLRRRGETGTWEDVFTAMKHEQPGFARILSTSRRLDDWRGVGPLPFTSRPRSAPGAFLAGDAGAVGDPFMGEGIGRALATAPLIAAAIEAAGPTAGADGIAAHYGAMWRRSYSGRLTIGTAARWLLERPWLVSPIIGGLLRPAVIARATPLFHRGAGFDRAVADAPKS
jgi:flavin-dependent dehydrogenase